MATQLITSIRRRHEGRYDEAKGVTLVLSALRQRNPSDITVFPAAAWVESGRSREIYCENDCDHAEYSERIPDVPEVS